VASDALLMGWRTYQSLAEVWPAQTGEFADKVNAMAKYVASPASTRPTGPPRRCARATWSRRWIEMRTGDRTI